VPYHSISQLPCLNVYLCNNAVFMLLISIYRCNKMESQKFFRMYTLQPCDEVYNNCLPDVQIKHENVITARYMMTKCNGNNH